MSTEIASIQTLSELGTEEQALLRPILDRHKRWCKQKLVLYILNDPVRGKMRVVAPHDPKIGIGDRVHSRGHWAYTLVTTSSEPDATAPLEVAERLVAHD